MRTLPKLPQLPKLQLDRQTARAAWGAARRHRRPLSIALAVALLAIACPLHNPGGNASKCLGVALAMSVLWVTEAIPLAATALLPIALLPLLGVCKAGVIASQYFDSVSCVCLSCLSLAAGVERRVPAALLLGFYTCAFVLSMWMSNASATLLLYPNAIASCTRAKTSSRVLRATLMAVMWGAEIGGCSTLIGTPTNLVLVRAYSAISPDDTSLITFSRWFAFAFPLTVLISVVGMIILYIWTFPPKWPRRLTWRRRRAHADADADAEAHEIGDIGLQSKCSGDPDVEAPTPEATCTVMVVEEAPATEKAESPNCSANATDEAARSDGNDEANAENTGAEAAGDGCEKGDKAECPAEAPSAGGNLEETPLPPATFEEVAITLLFCLVAMLWTFRTDMKFGSFVIRGWGRFLPNVDDGSTGIAIVLLCFLVPARRAVAESVATSLRAVSGSSGAALVAATGVGFGPAAPAAAPAGAEPRKRKWDTTILDFSTIKVIPWPMLILLGGGLALAKAFAISGLQAWLANLVPKDASAFTVVFVASAIAMLLTQVLTDVSCASVLMPVLGAVAKGMGLHPLVLMMPVVIATSLSMATPVGSGPNIFIFATGRLSVLDLLVPGGLECAICVVLISVLSVSLLPAVFGVWDLESGSG
eukprot:m51a1_g3119 putative tonoplast dicarboxylate transporter-like (649) ;mRNA; r:187773-190171